MRLVNTRTHRLETFSANHVPTYAILSHRWRDEELTYQEFMSRTIRRAERRAGYKAGYQKVLKACDITLAADLGYIWCDTCCIDKTSSAELSEAINSMYNWYEGAKVCYVYLDDVHNESDLYRSEWFGRGWTLQELIAPPIVEFLNQQWQPVGTKTSLQQTISSITSIPQSVLCGQTIFKYSVAQRMSWASRRKTERIEDAAYCLMGMFNVNIPLLYGEGYKAFFRLQEEILKYTDDDTIFAWSCSDREEHSLLATEPSYFSECSDVVRCIPDWPEQPQASPITFTNLGLSVRLPIAVESSYLDTHLAFLHCCHKSERGDCIGIFLRCIETNPSLRFVRIATPGKELGPIFLKDYAIKFVDLYVPQVDRNLELKANTRCGLQLEFPTHANSRRIQSRVVSKIAVTEQWHDSAHITLPLDFHGHIATIAFEDSMGLLGALRIGLSQDLYPVCMFYHASAVQRIGGIDDINSKEWQGAFWISNKVIRPPTNSDCPTDPYLVLGDGIYYLSLAWVTKKPSGRQRERTHKRLADQSEHGTPKPNFNGLELSASITELLINLRVWRRLTSQRRGWCVSLRTLDSTSQHVANNSLAMRQLQFLSLRT